MNFDPESDGHKYCSIPEKVSIFLSPRLSLSLFNFARILNLKCLFTGTLPWRQAHSNSVQVPGTVAVDVANAFYNVQGSINTNQRYYTHNVYKFPKLLVNTIIPQGRSHLYVCGESNWRLVLTEDGEEFTTDMAEGCEVLYTPKSTTTWS